MELRLKRLLPLIALLAAGCATTQSPPSLTTFIQETTSTAPFNHAIWGIHIEEEDGRVLYSQHADTLLMPASNRKLFVSALAANCIGVSSTIPTELWINGSVVGEMLFGDIILKGYGDPSLGGRYDADRDLRLLPFLEALRARGIHFVSGSVVADVSYFDREIIPGSWKYDNLGSSYAAPVDALAWNENAIGVLVDARDCATATATTDPNIIPVELKLTCAPRADNEEELLPAVASDPQNRLTVHGTLDLTTAEKPWVEIVGVANPGLYAATALDDFLNRNGIEIGAPPQIHTEPHEWTEKLATIESPPMYLLLGTFLKVSQNLFGEMFFKASSNTLPKSYQNARVVEERFLLDEVGLEPNHWSSADGSGLSVEDMVTPRAVVKVLRYMNRPETFGLYYELLATPGEEGTLRRRLAGMEKTMRGKTGSIDGVNALSGYVVGQDGRLRYFSIIANHHVGRSSAATNIIDNIVRRISEF